MIHLVDHQPEHGAYGLILNQPIGKTVGDFLDGDHFSNLKHLEVHSGGPVEQEQLTFSALWWTPKKGFRHAFRISLEEASDHAKRSGHIVRAFVGYSGWHAGQLENEIRKSTWMVTPPLKSVLGATHDRELWATLLRGLSPYHRILAEAPDDPSRN